MNALFYSSLAVAVAATAMVITRREAIHALLYLVVSLLAVAVAFFSLGASFAAALEVIIYAGAIVVLFVFVVMLLNLGPAAGEEERRWLGPRMFIGPGILASILLIELAFALSGGQIGGAVAREVSPSEVGRLLFDTYLLGVELAGLLLLAGLVGACHLGRADREEGDQSP